MNYYNEFEPYAAQWLRNLIDARHIPAGHVDTRSIKDVVASDLNGFTQCHFFAGLGGWSHALKLAGWPDDRPVWTGSCPCQPFSAAGKGAGTDDSRHLWPDWFRLISECLPVTIFGEQVSAAIRHGWLDLVSSDLESIDYSIGSAVMGAHSVGAPHIRQRLYFVGHAGSSRREELRRYGNERPQDSAGGCHHGSVSAFWTDCDWVPCADGKSRPVEPGTFPLAHGVSGRVGRLRAYGNAIVPQAAQTFIESYLAEAR